jgi:hypothetical protein
MALGACLGIASCQLAFLPNLGHRATFLLMVLLRVTIALVILFPRGAPIADHPLPPGDLRPGPPLHAPIAGAASSSSHPGTLLDPALILWVSVLSGFLTGGLAADLHEKVDFLGTSASFGRELVSFWALAGIFLASASATGPAAPGWNQVKALFVMGVLLHWATWDHVYMVRDWLVTCDAAPDATPWAPRAYSVAYFPSRTLHLVVLVGFLAFPPSFLMSSVLPLILNRAHSAGGPLDRVAGLQATSFAVGQLLFLGVAPQVDVFYAFKLSS